jgi:uncharacterized membrane protein YfhO
VDGLPAGVCRSNLLFRAVRLAPGTHTVEFAYRPRALVYGAVLSVVGLAAAAFLGVRRRRESER